MTDQLPKPGAARTPSVREVVAALDAMYDPRWAQSWDAVGLVCGDPNAAVRRVLFAVDPVDEVADEALDWGADLIVTHHPLLLRGVNSVAATTAKGRLIHRLICSGVALHTVHTNADSADPGVSDALAAAIGLEDLRPLSPAPDEALDKLEVMVSRDDADAALSPGRIGLGRVGTLPEAEPLSTFVRRVAAALPATAAGVRATGDPDRAVRTVAVCGGSGDSLLREAARAGADAYVTADLRHHPASEAEGPALVDAAHWATEWPWLSDAARRLEEALSVGGTTVETKVSEIVTDPWRLHV